MLILLVIQNIFRFLLWKILKFDFSIVATAWSISDPIIISFLSSNNLASFIFTKSPLPQPNKMIGMQRRVSNVILFFIRCITVY